MLHGHVVRQMCRGGVALSVVVGLRLAGMRQDILELMVLELVVVALEVMLMRLHLPFVVLERRLQLLLEVGFGLRLPLSVPSVLLWHRVLPLSLVLDGGGHHGREALGQLGRELQLLCTDGWTGALLLRCRRLLEAMQIMVIVVIVLPLLLRLGGLLAHL
jgi:hypothetical protein